MQISVYYVHTPLPELATAGIVLVYFLYPAPIKPLTI